MDDAIERMRERSRQAVAAGSTSLVARAYAKGIAVSFATDAVLYMEEMTLTEMAEEWNLADPIDLLKAIADADKDGKLPRAPKEPKS